MKTITELRRIVSRLRSTLWRRDKQIEEAKQIILLFERKYDMLIFLKEEEIKDNELLKKKVKHLEESRFMWQGFFFTLVAILLILIPYSFFII